MLRGWNVLLVTLDTTRQDRLGCYGLDGAGTPVLDRLAAEGVVFDHAIAHAPITLPTHASILTGTYPPFHGVRGNGFYRLPEERTTLAEVLSEAGYETAAVVAARVLDRRFGLAQGFDRFDDARDAMSRANLFTDYTRPAREVTDAALRAVDRFDVDSPWFLWVHYFDPHAPYEPPDEVAKSFPSTLEGRYQAEIATVDRNVGRLLEGLRERGRYDRTLIVVTADHGEGITGVHEELTHGIFVYRDTTLVPLIVAAPGVIEAGARRSEVVRQVDLFPTILELLELGEGDEVQGDSLVALLRGESDRVERRLAYTEAILPWYKFGWAPLLGISDARFKLIEAPTPELYDLATDPHEQRNLYDERPEVVAELRERLREVLREGSGIDGFSTDLVTTPEEREKLAALGYATSGRPVPEGEGIETLRDLKDPKDWAYVQDRIHRARALVTEGKSGEARGMLEELVAADSANYEAYAILVMLLIDAAELDEAERRIRQVLEFRPDMPQIHLAWGQLEERRARRLQAQGRAEESKRVLARAAGRYERAAELDRFETEAAVRASALHFEAGRFDEAERALRGALEVDPDDYRIPSTLAAVLVRLDRAEEAIGLFRDALAIAPDDPALQRPVRGQLLQAQLAVGNFDGARRTVDWLEERYPDDPNTGRIREMIDRLERERASDRGD